MQTYDAHKTSTETRQATPQKTNLRVLIISTIVVVALFAIVFVAFNVFAPGTSPA